MIVLKTQEDLKSYISELKNNNKIIGFCPTMGALHSGHLSLVEESKKENDVSIVSIFVNPTQFNNQEDLQKYPKTEEKDISLLNSINCDAVYIPRTEDIYPEGLQKNNYSLNGLDSVMEGAFRPGHFDGVVEVVSRLFKQVQPDRAYFGEKDFQQLLVVKEMVKQFNFKIQIIGVPMKREISGLAMSSRNKRLSQEGLLEASKIYSILQKVVNWDDENISFKDIEERVYQEFSKTKMELEYFYIADKNTLEITQNKQQGKYYRAFVAVFLENVRLIDNIEL